MPTYPFPILWSGGVEWTVDSPASPYAEGLAYWHSGGTAELNYYPHNLASVDALFTDTNDAQVYWPLDETPGGTGTGVYAAEVGTLDLDAVTAVMSQGDITIPNDSNSQQGIEFDGTGDVKVTNDGSIVFSGATGWGVVLAYKPDTIGVARTLFSVAGTDGFTIGVDASNKVTFEKNGVGYGYYGATTASLESGVVNVIGVEVDPSDAFWTNITFYINGESYTLPVPDFAASTVSHADNTAIEIGEDADGSIGFVAVLPTGYYIDSSRIDSALHDLLLLGFTTDLGEFTDEIDLTQTGRPTLKVAVNGEEVLDELQTANWRLGKEDWFAPLEPNSGSLTFIGLVDAVVGDDVVVYNEFGPLWSGSADDVVSVSDSDGLWRTTIAVIDVLGRIGKTELIDVAESGNTPPGTQLTAQEHISAVLSEYGINVTFEESTSNPVSGGYAEFTNPAYTGDLIGYINAVADRGNMVIVLNRQGNLIWTKRQPYAYTVQAIPLVGDDSPSQWIETFSKAAIINRIYSEDSGGSVYVEINDTDSQAIYGIKEYTFDAPNSWTGYNGGEFSDDLMEGLAEGRPIIEGKFYVTDLQQRSVSIEPLDVVEHFDVAYAITSVEHVVTRDAWEVNVNAERDLNGLHGIDSSLGYENPTGETIDIQTITASKDALIVREDDGTKKGAGASTYLPVGINVDGDVFRALIEFNITWPTGFVRVRKAQLKLQTSDESIVQHGSEPKVVVQRSARAWTEGTESSPSINNDVVWNDTYGLVAGQTIKRLDNANNRTVYLDVTDIAQDWYDRGNDGLIIQSANERRKRNRVEFYSSDHGSGDAPQLILECVVE